MPAVGGRLLPYSTARLTGRVAFAVRSPVLSHVWLSWSWRDIMAMAEIDWAVKAKYHTASQDWRMGMEKVAVLGGGLAVPCTCNPLQQG